MSKNKKIGGDMKKETTKYIIDKLIEVAVLLTERCKKIETDTLKNVISQKEKMLDLEKRIGALENENR
jgi:hypothetical protein